MAVASRAWTALGATAGPHSYSLGACQLQLRPNLLGTPRTYLILILVKDLGHGVQGHPRHFSTRISVSALYADAASLPSTASLRPQYSSHYVYLPAIVKCAHAEFSYVSVKQALSSWSCRAGRCSGEMKLNFEYSLFYDTTNQMMTSMPPKSSYTARTLYPFLSVPAFYSQEAVSTPLPLSIPIPPLPPLLPRDFLPSPPSALLRLLLVSRIFPRSLVRSPAIVPVLWCPGTVIVVIIVGIAAVVWVASIAGFGVVGLVA